METAPTLEQSAPQLIVLKTFGEITAAENAVRFFAPQDPENTEQVELAGQLTGKLTYLLADYGASLDDVRAGATSWDGTFSEAENNVLATALWAMAETAKNVPYEESVTMRALSSLSRRIARLDSSQGHTADDSLDSKIEKLKGQYQYRIALGVAHHHGPEAANLLRDQSEIQLPLFPRALVSRPLDPATRALNFSIQMPQWYPEGAYAGMTQPQAVLADGVITPWKHPENTRPKYSLQERHKPAAGKELNTQWRQELIPIAIGHKLVAENVALHKPAGRLDDKALGRKVKPAFR
jgi:hypothetical protein